MLFNTKGSGNFASPCSNVLKFADDTKVHRVVDNRFDGVQLQSDLDSLGD